MRTLIWLVVVVSFLAALPAAATTACNPSMPPQAEGSSKGWFGTNALEALVPSDGVWRGMGPIYNYRDKLFWRSPGLRPGVEAELVVTGRRIDGDAPPASISAITNAHAEGLGGWSLLVGVEFPTPGCWELTGQYVGHSLSFTVLVPAPAEQPQCADQGLRPDCTIEGAWMMQSVDSERLFLAVDVEASGPGLDHLFLLTGSRLHLPVPETGSGLLRYDPGGSAIRVEDGQSHATILELRNLSVSHYWGYGEEGPDLAELQSPRLAPICTHVPGSCWETERGWRLDFPH